MPTIPVLVITRLLSDRPLVSPIKALLSLAPKYPVVLLSLMRICAKSSELENRATLSVVSLFTSSL